MSEFLTKHIETLPNGTSFEMVYIEGGEFMMGSESKVALLREDPIHPVHLDSFYMGKFPLTQSVWQAVMGSNPSYFVGEDRPVETVSWKDCQAFLKKLSKKTGRAYRLPTEAEWEYAARGGQQSQGCVYAGSETLSKVGWFYRKGFRGSKPVGCKLPNELGLYDMSGNVWEWCQDWYSGKYYEACAKQGLVLNPQGPEMGANRVVRGGSWYLISEGCRSTNRYFNDPEFRLNDLGFRLVFSPSQLAVDPGLPVS